MDSVTFLCLDFKAGFETRLTFELDVDLALAESIVFRAGSDILLTFELDLSAIIISRVFKAGSNIRLILELDVDLALLTLKGK